MVWDEADIVTERISGLQASDALLLQSALMTGVGAFAKDGGRKARTHFDRIIKRLFAWRTTSNS